jgi:hypothetical protein
MQLRNTIVIDAAPERVWEVLGDLAATDESAGRRHGGSP